MVDEKVNRMNSLQVLRALAFLGVFTTHTEIRCFSGAGAWGVSVFFILSGFVMVYSYYGKNRIESVSITKSLLFAWNKIKRIYPLHVVTTFAMAIFMFVGENTEPIGESVTKLLLNLALIQQWFPVSGLSINNVSWYLCVALFSYILFPIVLKYMEKGYSVSKAKRMIVILFLLQIMIALIGSYLPNWFEKNWTNRDITYWFVYQFPPVRILDFMIGCNVGYLFLVRNLAKPVNESKYTIYELVTFVLIIAANIMYIMLTPLQGVAGSVHPERWWTYTIIFTISSCMIVYLFAWNEGRITKFLGNRKYLLYLGNISQYTFLIHFVVFTYLWKLYCRLVGDEFCAYQLKWIKLSVGFILTLVATKIWMELIKRLGSRQ